MTSSGVPTDALSAIWERHREVVLARLDAIERATAYGADMEVRTEGARAAHQLAGAVGTFGFARATEMARELEARLSASGTPAPELPALARGLRRELARDVGGAQDAAPAGRPRVRVLAVDDDPLILQSVRALLAGRGLEVVIEDDPLRVVALLPQIAPDLLFLDVDMPALNGIELCRRIRADPRHQDLCIVFLTTHTDTETVAAAYRAGADGHLSKPVVGGELAAWIERHLPGVAATT